MIQKPTKENLDKAISKSNNLEDAAKLFGVSRRTLSRWLLEKKKIKKQNKKTTEIKSINQSINFDKDNYNGIVVTSCLNDTLIFNEFWMNLKYYCKLKNYKLLVIKNKYLNPSLINSGNNVTWPKECIPYFLDTTMYYKDQFKIIGDCNVQATAIKPLTGIDGLCEGMTTIVGHSTVQMISLAVNSTKNNVILHSTGSISKKDNYSASKAGYRSSFHHSTAAVVIEIDKKTDKFFIRQLSSDKQGTFYDLDEKFENEKCTKSKIKAIYLGDEHVLFKDQKVSDATFGKNGIVQTLKPEFILRGDVLDCFSVSHHHKNNFFSNYKKHQVTKKGNIENELNETLDYIYSTTPVFSTSLLVNGNHEEHLDKWLNISDPKDDIVNAKLYHRLMYLKIKEIDDKKERGAFEIYKDEIYTGSKIQKVKSCIQGFNILGINVSMHGDKGPNGSRGSINNLSKIGEKSIIGHSHTPGISGGCWQVGTSSLMNLEYVSGPSSWLHTHCIIQPNGKRQLITIVSGEWKAK